MSRNNSLSCLEKRDLLNQSVASTKSLMEWGQRMEESELLHDALSFYEKAGARDAIIGIRTIAQEEGDFFLFRRANRALGEEPAPEVLLAVGTRAAETGKMAFAAEAFRLAGREDLLNELSRPSVEPS